MLIKLNFIHEMNAFYIYVFQWSRRITLTLKYWNNRMIDFDDKILDG